jgi:hypothetical protein
VAAALLAEREPFYARAHHRVDTVGRAPADVTREIVERLAVGSGAAHAHGSRGGAS